MLKKEYSIKGEKNIKEFKINYKNLIAQLKALGKDPEPSAAHKICEKIFTLTCVNTLAQEWDMAKLYYDDHINLIELGNNTQEIGEKEQYFIQAEKHLEIADKYCDKTKVTKKVTQEMLLAFRAAVDVARKAFLPIAPGFSESMEENAAEEQNNQGHLNRNGLFYNENSARKKSKREQEVTPDTNCEDNHYTETKFG